MYNVVEFFSGIGSQAEALHNMGLKGETLGTCEWDVHAIIAYDLIHNSPEIPEEIIDLAESVADCIKKAYSSGSLTAIKDCQL